MYNTLIPLIPGPSTWSDTSLTLDEGFSDGVVASYDTNEMWYISVKHTQGNSHTVNNPTPISYTSEHRHNKDGNKTSHRAVCKGTFQCNGIEHRLNYGESPDVNNTYVVLYICPPDIPKRYIRVPYNDYTDAAKLVKILKNYAICIDKKYLAIWLRANTPSFLETTATTINIGWWKSEYGQLKTDKETEYREGFDGSLENPANLTKMLDITYGRSDNCQSVFLFSALLASELRLMFFIYGISNLASVFIHCSDEADFIERIKCLMKNHAVIYNSDCKKLGENRDKCSIIRIDIGSEYHSRAIVNGSSGVSKELSVIVTEKSFARFGENIINSFLCFECDSVRLKGYIPLLCLFVTKALDNVDLMTALIIQYQKHSKDFGEAAKSGVANTAALLMSIAEIFLVPILPKNWFAELLQELQVFLYYAIDGCASDITELFIKQITSLRDFPVVTKDGYDKNCEQLVYNGSKIYLNRITMIHIASNLNIPVRTLCEHLKSKNMLDTDEGYQKSVNINGTTERFYALKQQSIFSTGDVRMEINEFAGAEPKMMLQLGINNGLTDVFLSLKELDGSENGHVMITGSTRTGKSNFLRHIAIQAAANGIKVINLGTDESILTLFGEGIQTLRYLKKAEKAFDEMTADASPDFDWDEVFSNNDISIICVEYNEALNMALDELYDYKVKHNDGTPCLLILDECQEFSMDGRSPLVAKVIRKGAKHGFMAFLSSQYLKPKNGSDEIKVMSLCGTKIVFHPAVTGDALKLMGSSSKDTDLKELLEGLDKGECVVQGSISTKKCWINYPVKVKVPRQD